MSLGLRFLDVEGIVSPPFHMADLHSGNEFPEHSQESPHVVIIAEKFAGLIFGAGGECERGDGELFAGYAGIGSVI